MPDSVTLQTNSEHGVSTVLRIIDLDTFYLLVMDYSIDELIETFENFSHSSPISGDSIIKWRNDHA